MNLKLYFQPKKDFSYRHGLVTEYKLLWTVIEKVFESLLHIKNFSSFEDQITVITPSQIQLPPQTSYKTVLNQLGPRSLHKPHLLGDHIQRRFDLLQPLSYEQESHFALLDIHTMILTMKYTVITSNKRGILIIT